MPTATIIIIITDEGPIEISAILAPRTMGTLAIHRSPKARGGVGKTWRVTHVPSGMTVDSYRPFQTRRAAEAFAKDAWGRLTEPARRAMASISNYEVMAESEHWDGIAAAFAAARARCDDMPPQDQN